MSAYDQARASVARTIEEIKKARQAATAELIAYKAEAKLMATRIEELTAAAATWDRRSEEAVLAGDDALAGAALARKAEVHAELGRARADRAEQEHHAAELLRGRRELDVKLRGLELREGTVAAGLAAAHGPGDAPLFDRFEDAERRIEEEAIEGELSATETEEAALAPRLRELQTDDALAALKKKMRGE